MIPSPFRQTGPHPKDKPWPALGALLVGVFGGLLLLVPPNRPFGFLELIPLLLRSMLGMGLVACGLFAPRLVEKVDDLPARWDVTRLSPWLWLVGGMVLFWLGAERTHYGDGLLKLQLLGGADFRATPPYIWKAPLDGLIGYLSTRAALALSLPAKVGITAQSVVAGGIYLLAVLAIARRLSAKPGDRLLILLGMMALGSSQLWFGHVENYSLVTALTAVTVAAGLAWLDGDGRLAAVGLLGGAAITLHPQALFAMMALPLLTTRRGRISQLVLLAGVGLVVPLLTVGILLALGVPLPDPAGGYVGDHQLFWTWSQFVNSARLVENVEGLWLLAPALPVLVLILAGSGWLRRLGGDAKLRFVAGVSVGLLIYYFAFQNDLPRWQDWDLYAIVGPGVALWGLTAWARMPDSPAKLRIAHLLLPGLAFALAVTAGWIGVNRAYRLLDPDPANRGYVADYVAVNLIDRLPDAQISPQTPICEGVADDATGCQRVAPLTITMPTTGEARHALFAHAPAQVGFPLTLPDEPSFLWVSPILDPAAWNWGGDGVLFQVEVDDGSARRTLWAEQITHSAMPDRGWAEVAVDLADFRGRTVTLWLMTDVGPVDNGDGDRSVWGTPWIVRGTPNIYTR